MHTRIQTMVMLLAAALLAVAAAGCMGTGEELQADKPSGKIKITKLDDLPRHTYPVTRKASEIVLSENDLADLAGKVRKDVETDLAAYEINDATTLKRFYGTLANIHLLQKDDARALPYLDKVRDLEEKEAARLMSSLSTRALIAARSDVGKDAGPAELGPAFSKHLAERAGALPWKAVQDDIQETKGLMEMFSENLLVGLVQAQIDPVVAGTGELDMDQAASLFRMNIMIKQNLPLKNEVIAVLQGLIDANKIVKPDIWAARSVILAGNAGLNRVLAAVWDSGTDPAVFDKRLFTNATEKLDGKDTDSNGFVDDVHGIAFDIHARRTTGLLYPLGDTEGRIASVMQHIKGLTDLRSAVDSPEAAAFKQHISSLKPDEVKGFIEDVSLAGSYSHGTHVAGLMADGNPFIELLIARLSYDHRTVPVARTEEWGKRDGEKCRDTVDYFKAAGVRVVNMSWGEALEDAEASLRSNGIGENAEERLEIARRVFALQKAGLHDAIAGAPEILFVAAAGNSDNDVEFDDFIPSSFDLPNLLVVGAVDQAGDPTSFTSFGGTVKVYANGFEVESYVPGGKRMKMSGTSMASPNVANLAGKLLALDPGLKPPETIDLILKGADRNTVGTHSFLLMNPKRSVEILRSRLSSN